MRDDDIIVPDPDHGESAPERRVDNLGREAFALAVTAATKAATQEIAAIHRRRLVVQSALAAGLVTLLVGLLAGYGLYRSERSVAKTNALYNCHLIGRLSIPLAAFVRTDSDEVDKRTVHYWLHVIYPELLAVSASDCAASLK